MRHTGAIIYKRIGEVMEVQVTPASFLRPNNDCQWEVIIPHRLTELLELLILGDHAADNHTGSVYKEDER